MKTLILSSFVLSSLCFANGNTIVIDNMSCGSCVKQVTKAVCNDKDISTWFDSCKPEIVDGEKMVGKVTYTLKKGLTLDADKKKKIETALEGSGRKVIEYK